MLQLQTIFILVSEKMCVALKLMTCSFLAKHRAKNSLELCTGVRVSLSLFFLLFFHKKSDEKSLASLVSRSSIETLSPQNK